MLRDPSPDHSPDDARSQAFVVEGRHNQQTAGMNAPGTGSSERRRVLLLTPRLLDTSGGRACTDLALGLDRELFEPVVCCYAGWGPLAEELESAGLEIFPLRRRNGIDPAFAFALAREIRRRRIDVVHGLHAAKAYVVGVLSGVLAGAHTGVTTFRERPEVSSDWMRKAGRLCGEIVGTVVATSPEVRDALLEERWVPPGKTLVVPDGVDLTRFERPELRSEARKLWDLDPDAPVLGVVLQSQSQREWELVEEAFEVVLSEEPSARLLCCGKVGTRGPILGLGHFADTPAFYAAIDALCVPIESRSVPLTLLEGLAAGVPIAASHRPDGEGLAPAGPWGFTNLTASGARSLGRGLLELLREHDAARALAREGRSCVARDYSVAANVARVQRLYS